MIESENITKATEEIRDILEKYDLSGMYCITDGEYKGEHLVLSKSSTIFHFLNTTDDGTSLIGNLSETLSLPKIFELVKNSLNVTQILSGGLEGLSERLHHTISTAIVLNTSVKLKSGYSAPTGAKNDVH